MEFSCWKCKKHKSDAHGGNNLMTKDEDQVRVCDKCAQILAGQGWNNEVKMRDAALCV